MKKVFIFFLSLWSLSSVLAQKLDPDSLSNGNLVFWTSQKWECEFLKIEIFDEDTNLVLEGKLKESYKGINIPECSNESTLTFSNIPKGSYFFVADCSKELCPVCLGEGSYWQPIVHNAQNSGRGTKSKGDIKGTWKTCTTCGGNGSASQILWIDTFNIQSNYCRSVLLQ